MLAKLVADIPPGLLYEPKWDGFRAIVERDGEAVELHSRNGKPMARYFPDLVEAFLRDLPSRCVVDGEIVVIGTSGRLDFFALQQRVHPAASRVGRLAAETPASFIGFDLLDDAALPFAERGAPLGATAAGAAAVRHAGDGRSRARARVVRALRGRGLDGIIAKDPAPPYRPGVRAMYKVKHQRTVDCVVCGYRLHKSAPDAIGSLLLGLFQDGEGPSWASDVGELVPIGATASFPMARRRELLTELRALRPEIPRSEHPWGAFVEAGGTAGTRPASRQFVALSPVRVIEVRSTTWTAASSATRQRSSTLPGDRDAASCGFAQLERPAGFDVASIIH